MIQRVFVYGIHACHGSISSQRWEMDDIYVNCDSLTGLVVNSAGSHQESQPRIEGIIRVIRFSVLNITQFSVVCTLVYTINLYAYICIQTNTYIHICIHTYTIRTHNTHTYIIRMLACISISVYVKCIYICMYIRGMYVLYACMYCMHACIECIQACMNKQICMSIRMCVKCMYVFKYVVIQACMYL